MLNPVTPGNHTFFVHAKATFGTQEEYIEYKLMISPCDPTVDIITSPTDYSKVSYFKSFDAQSNQVNFQIDFDKVSAEDLKANKTKFMLP